MTIHNNKKAIESMSENLKNSLENNVLESFVDSNTNKERCKICGYGSAGCSHAVPSQDDEMDKLRYDLTFNKKVEDTQPSGEWEEEFDNKWGSIFAKKSTFHEIKPFIHSLLLTQRSKLKDRIENVFASKYEGMQRIDTFYERAILNCFDDSNFTAKE